jgi:hypothetical protein
MLQRYKMDAQNLFTLLEAISLIASIASLVLAVIAIFLSIIFFQMSSELARTASEASKGISASVERLEKLFDKLYADTFSMMRDTVSDMRRHIWPEETKSIDRFSEESERRADEKVKELKETVDSELSAVLRRQALTDEKIGVVNKEMRELLATAIARSRHAEIEAREETLREHILQEIEKKNREQTDTLAINLVESLNSSPSRVIVELQRLAEDGIIELDGGPEHIAPDTKITLRDRSQRSIARKRSR